MRMIMIATHYNTRGKLIGYRLLNLDTLEVIDTDSKSIFRAIDNNIDIINLCISNNKIKGSNGELGRYPKLMCNELLGKSPLIVLKKFNNGDYTVSSYLGEVIRMQKYAILDYASTEGIANGKVVNGSICSINGEYDKEKEIDYQEKAKITQAKLNMLCNKTYEVDENNRIRIIDNKIKMCNIPKGISGIADDGFRWCRDLSAVWIPDTVKYIGKGAFSNCFNLKYIIIPEGVTEILPYTFENCNNLKAVILPNSLRVIHDRAFSRVSRLKVIYIGNMGMEIKDMTLQLGVWRLNRHDHLKEVEDIVGKIRSNIK